MLLSSQVNSVRLSAFRDRVILMGFIVHRKQTFHFRSSHGFTASSKLLWASITSHTTDDAFVIRQPTPDCVTSYNKPTKVRVDRLYLHPAKQHMRMKDSFNGSFSFLCYRVDSEYRIKLNRFVRLKPQQTEVEGCLKMKMKMVWSKKWGKRNHVCAKGVDGSGVQLCFHWRGMHV